VAAHARPARNIVSSLEVKFLNFGIESLQCIFGDRITLTAQGKAKVGKNFTASELPDLAKLILDNYRSQNKYIYFIFHPLADPTSFSVTVAVYPDLISRVAEHEKPYVEFKFSFHNKRDYETAEALERACHACEDRKKIYENRDLKGADKENASNAYKESCVEVIRAMAEAMETKDPDQAARSLETLKSDLYSISGCYEVVRQFCNRIC